jgi:hypothetical protein
VKTIPPKINEIGTLPMLEKHEEGTLVWLLPSHFKHLTQCLTVFGMQISSVDVPTAEAEEYKY